MDFQPALVLVKHAYPVTETLSPLFGGVIFWWNASPYSFGAHILLTERKLSHPGDERLTIFEAENTVNPSTAMS